MAVDKRELILDLLARDKSKQATDSFSKNMEGVADAADDAAKSTDKLSKSAKVNADRIGKLDREIGLAENELRSLARAFADTDDAAERLDLSKAVRRLENDLRRLGKNKGILAGILPDPEPDGRGFGRKLVGAIAEGGASIATKAGASVGPVVGGAIGAAAAPVLVSTLGSALSAGIGSGVLGVGLAAAAKDPVVQIRGKQVGKRFTEALQGEASEAFQGPVLQSLAKLEAAGERTTTKLGKAFDELAPHLDPLVTKFTIAGERLTDSFVKAAGESGPALAGLGDSVVLLSDGVGDFIDKVSDGGPEAADNLRLLAGATADLARYTGNTLDVMSKLANNEWVTGPLLPLLRKHYKEVAAEQVEANSGLVKLGEGFTTLAGKLQVTTLAAQGNREAMAALNKEMRASVDPLFGFVEAQEQVEEAQKKVNKEIKEHGPNSEQAAAATRDLAGAALDLQGKAAAVGTTADGKLTPALRRTLVAAGLTEKQIKGVERELKDAKAAADRYDKVNAKAKVEVDGVPAARKKIRSIMDDLRAFDGVWTAQMKANFGKHGKPGTGGGLSTGGYVDGPGTSTSDSIPMRLSKGEYVVRAAEVAKPGVRQMLESLNSGGGYVGAPASSTAMRAGWPGGQAGVQTVRVEIDVTGGDRDMIALIRRWIRTHNLLQDR